MNVFQLFRTDELRVLVHALETSYETDDVQRDLHALLAVEARSLLREREKEEARRDLIHEWSPFLKEFDIWSEGFAATGQSGVAYKHNTQPIEAESFQEACELFALREPQFMLYFDKQKLTYWGCGLFDNEVDARRSFG